MKKEKIAVVTGGTRGIGGAISLALASASYKVFSLYARNTEAAGKLMVIAREQKLKIETLRGDLTKEEAFLEVIGEIKKAVDHVDVLVHSAASGVHRNVLDLKDKHLRWTYEINVFAFHRLLVELLPLISAGGSIIGLTSLGGKLLIPDYGAIGSSKAALESLFQHYALELAPRNIAVNLVCPGTVHTDVIDSFPDSASRLERASKTTPTGRLSRLEEIAEMVTFLCESSVGRQIIGQTITIDGGRSLKAQENLWK